MTTTEIPSYVEVWLRKDPIAIVHAEGVGVKLGMIVEDDTVCPAVPRNLSTAIAVALVLTDPDGVRTSYPMKFADFGAALGTGVDGAVMVVLGTSDTLNQAGTWKAQVEVIATGALRYSTEEVYFIVRAAANASISILPETLLPGLHIAWWRNLYTIGNPGRLGTWLDMWQGTGLDAPSVAAGGGPARLDPDPLFGGKPSFNYDEQRELNAGVAADFNALHDGTGATLWGDIMHNEPLEVDSLFGTAGSPAQAGVEMKLDGPTGELVFNVYNKSGVALHALRSGVGSIIAGQRHRFAIDWCLEDPSNVDIRMYLDGVLVASANTVYPNVPSTDDAFAELHVGQNAQSTSTRYRGKVAELGFIKQCRLAPEMSAYLMAQP